MVCSHSVRLYAATVGDHHMQPQEHVYLANYLIHKMPIRDGDGRLGILQCASMRLDHPTHNSQWLLLLLHRHTLAHSSGMHLSQIHHISPCTNKQSFNIYADCYTSYIEISTY